MRFSRPSTRPAAAFTMIEIAMSLAIIGFALVAIIGILPQGMDVQKENRRETIINQDANYLVQAIRGGDAATNGLNDLTNYIISITNYWTAYNVAGTTLTVLSNGLDSYTNNGTAAGIFSVTSVTNSTTYALTNGAHIIGLLSTPEYVPLANNNDFRSNYVAVYFHAMSGDAAEKYPQTNALIKDASFGYRLVSQVMPWGSGAAYMDPAQTNFADFELVGNSAGSNSANQFVTNWAQTLVTNGNLNVTNFNYVFFSPPGSTNPVAWTITNLNISDSVTFQHRANAWLASRTQQNNLYDVRLLFRWLLLPNGQVGNGRQTYRTMVGGILTNQYTSTVTNIAAGVIITNFTPYWYFQSENYSALSANSL